VAVGEASDRAWRLAWNRRGAVVGLGKPAAGGGGRGGDLRVMGVDSADGETRPDAFGILGPLEVLRSGRAVPLGGPRQRAMLALLLVEANRAVSMDRLAQDL